MSVEITPSGIVVPSLKILHADDERLHRLLAGKFLVSAGHTVESVSNADEALKKLADEKFELTITDGIMPGMNGEQLLDTIRGDKNNDEMAVLLLSGTVKQFQFEKFDAWESKPFTSIKLIAAVNRAYTYRQRILGRTP